MSLHPRFAGLRSEKGLTGLEILAIIGILILLAAAVAAVSGWLTSNSIGKDNACINQLNAAQSATQAWVKTVTPGDPFGDRILCTTAKNLVEKYNPQCAERIGAIPVPKCE